MSAPGVRACLPQVACLSAPGVRACLPRGACVLEREGKFGVSPQRHSMDMIAMRHCSSKMTEATTLRRAFPSPQRPPFFLILHKPQAFYLTGLASSPGAGGPKNAATAAAEARKVLLRAIVTLRNADFVGVMEDMGRLVRLLRCTLGVGALEPPNAAVMHGVRRALCGMHGVREGCSMGHAGG